MAKVDPYGQVHYLFADRLGSAWAMTDAQGFYEQIWHYYPYGGKRLVYDTLTDPNTGWWKKNRHRFTGLWRDDETGLDHTLFRQYASHLGRWLTPDPIAGDIETPGSLNRYTYVLNNPVNFVDPLGLFATPCFGYCPPVAPPSPPYGPSPDPAGYEPPNPYGDTGGCTAPDGQCGGRPNEQGGGGQTGIEIKNPSKEGKQQDLITETLEKLLEKLRQDIDCLNFLGGNSAIEILGTVLEGRYYGHAEIRTKEGPAYTIGAVTPGAEGQIITVNRVGLFFSAFPGGKKDLTVGGYAGATGPARALILLHELGHVTGVLGSDANAPDVSAANTQKVQANCSKTVHGF